MRSAVGGVLVVLVMAVGACHPIPQGTGSLMAVTGRETVITELDIERMSVRTAWDVVRMRAPRITFGQDEAGRPARIRIQESRTHNADETPLLVVDGVPTGDIALLQQIPAFDVRVIRILSAEAAQPLFGLRAASGAIVIETKHPR